MVESPALRRRAGYKIRPGIPDELLFYHLIQEMSSYNQDHEYGPSLALNTPDGPWETHDPIPCFGTSETIMFTQADIDSYNNEWSHFVQQQNMVMGNNGFVSGAFPELSSGPSMTELYTDCDDSIKYPHSPPSPQ